MTTQPARPAHLLADSATAPEEVEVAEATDEEDVRDGPDEVDVAVVGAGPAGSAAALAVLQRNPEARVALLDRAAFPRDKVCGDGVAPHVLDLLAGLGEPHLLEDWPRVSRLRLGFGGGPEARGRLDPPGLVVPRAVLDARLAGAAVRRGARLLRHRVRSVQVRRDCVAVDRVLRARVVVAADGAHSAVRRALGLPPNPPGRVAVALRGYAPARGALEQEIVFDDERWPAYAWSFPLGDGRANVGYGEVLRPGPAPSRALLEERLDALLPGRGDGGSAWRAHHLPLSSWRPRQPGGPVLLAGDAASLVNPLTGEGIAYAVASGALAGRVAARTLRGGVPDPGRLYRAQLHAMLGRHLRHITLAAMLTGPRAPGLRGLVSGPGLVRAGVAAAADDERVFADLVELGLARGHLTPRVLLGLARVAHRMPAPRRADIDALGRGVVGPGGPGIR